MRIGIFGGSFDPIHLGHLILAERCRENAELDQVWFMPSFLAPHKQDGAHGNDRQRMEMIELAIGGHEAFVLSKIELERGGVSYTVDTLEQVHENHPEDEFFLLIGDDSLEDFSSWRNPQRICELAIPLVVNRPGSGEVDLSLLKPFVSGSRFDQIDKWKIQCPKIEISSTDLRARIRDGKSIRFLTPRGVEKYIETQQVYLAKK
jgi:nicotinate-nucleotide adenylyltransferase